MKRRKSSPPEDTATEESTRDRVSMASRRLFRRPWMVSPEERHRTRSGLAPGPAGAQRGEPGPPRSCLRNPSSARMAATAEATSGSSLSCALNVSIKSERQRAASGPARDCSPSRPCPSPPPLPSVLIAAPLRSARRRAWGGPARGVPGWGAPARGVIHGRRYRCCCCCWCPAGAMSAGQRGRGAPAALGVLRGVHCGEAEPGSRAPWLGRCPG